ncbi:MAG: tetratricopeptide repeat protein [Salinivirgaceae bacterium]
MRNNFNIILFFLFALVSKSNAQFKYSDTEKSIHNAILELKCKSFPNPAGTNVNGVINWLEAYHSFVNFKTTSQSILLDSVLTKIEIQKNKIEKLKADNPYYHYCLADINLMICYLYYENGNVLKSINAYWNAKKHNKTNEEKYPDFSLNQKHSLIFKATDDWVNSNVFGKKTESIEFWKSEFQSSLNEAKSKFKESSVSYREIELAGFILPVLFGDISPERLPDISIPSPDFAKKGPLEAFTTVLIYNKVEQYQKNLKVLAIADSMRFNQRCNMLNLWYGIALLNNRSPSSVNYLQLFLKNQENNNQVTYARLKLSWYFLLTNQLKPADSLLALIRQSPISKVWTDQQAKYEAVHAVDWLPEIIKSRLLFDGGDYSNSINVLLSLKKSIHTFNQSQKLEYAYRLARAYHKVGEPSKAIPFYQMALNSNLDYEFYYPAYSAFYLGELFKNSNESSFAIKYYNKCLQLDSPIYKAEIHRKAKTEKENLE